MTHDTTRPASCPADRPSRREFLSRSAAAAGAGALLGVWPEPSRRPVPRAAPRAPLRPGDPIRMGVIGTGGMGTAHCRAFTSLAKKGRENVRIVALSDVCRPRLENARNVCKQRQTDVSVDTYVDYHDLLARDDLHGVLIASPEHWHQQMAEDAIAAGKDVYLEKPMTLRLAQAIRLHEVAKANPDIRVQIGTQYIMEPNYHEARKILEEGGIGKPTFSQTSYCRNSKKGEWLYRIDPRVQPGKTLDWERWCGPLGLQEWDPEIYHRWRRYRKYSTGIIGDLLVHMMTPLFFCNDQGWPTRVVACGGHLVDKKMENHDQVNLTVEFEKGHILVVAGSVVNEKGLEVMVRGHRATLYLGGSDCVLRPERPFVDEVEPRTVRCRDEIGAHDSLRLDWLASIRTRKPNISPVELGFKVMVVVDLATRSLWEGAAFRFDPRTLEAHAI